MRARSWGFTLPEILVASGLFLLLATIMLAGWLQGTRAWRTIAERNEVLGQAQRFLRHTEKELESTSAQGVEIRKTPNDAMAYASTFAVDQPSKFAVDEVSGGLRWQKQVVLYHHASTQTVRRRQITLPAASPGRLTPIPISRLDLGSGPQPVQSYALNGEVAARKVDKLELELEGRAVVIKLRLQTSSSRQAAFESRTLLRN